MFWFLVIFAGLNFFSFLFLFKDTFRRERSSTYQIVLKNRMLERARAQAQRASSQVTMTDALGVSAEGRIGTRTSVAEALPVKAIKVSLKDINPFPPLLLILRRRNNLAILFASGLSLTFLFM